LEISLLQLQNFRNFSELELNFKPEGALIHGKNGIGKTNLLEAISFFAFGKSFRTKHDVDLINFSKAFFRLEANFTINGKHFVFEASADKNIKQIKIDETNILKTSELFQYLKIVYFSPQDIRIISGPPAERRRFFDLAISQYSYNYLQLLRKYYRILKQRNALLKTRFKNLEKKTWDEQFIDIACQVIEFRLDYLKNFILLLTDTYSQISNNHEELDVKYKFSFANFYGENLKDNLRNHLEDTEKSEIESQRSLSGPHLDDIQFSFDEHPARSFGSQGQQRSLVIAARLVQANLISKKTKDTPILIFDDVLADLDKERALNIIHLLKKKHQIFIATPNVKNYEGFHLQNINLEELA